jgi:hypothetical protein
MDLPDGFVAETAAPPSLVKHPIMASLGARDFRRFASVEIYRPEQWQR